MLQGSQSQGDAYAFAMTDLGLVRKNNEDGFLMAPNIRLYLLADGMGGHNAGHIASKVAVETLAAIMAEPPSNRK
jgi:protein phosphatase